MFDVVPDAAGGCPAAGRSVLPSPVAAAAPVNAMWYVLSWSKRMLGGGAATGRYETGTSAAASA